MAKKNNRVYVAKAQRQPTPGDESRQLDGFSAIDGVQEYVQYSPNVLLYAYDNSFAIGGIVDRVATSASSGFTYPDTPPVSEYTQNVLESIDLQSVFQSLYATGNYFFEKVRNLDGTIAELRPFMTEQVRIKIERTEMEDGRNITTLSYVQMARNAIIIPFAKEDVVHIKMPSLRDRYYGASKIGRVLPQVLLLGYIDKYYNRFFDRGAIKSIVLSVPEGSLSEEEELKIKTTIEDFGKGVENAFNMMLLPGDIKFITDLVQNLDDAAFLGLRDKLIEAISISTNIPIDIILSNQSNRNTKTESLEELNRDIAIPLQQIFLRGLKSQVSEKELPGIKDVSLYSIDTKNQLEEMKVLTGYVDSGVFTPNEARKEVDKEPRIDGDTLGKRSTSPSSQDTPPQDTGVVTANMQKIEKVMKELYE